MTALVVTSVSLLLICVFLVWRIARLRGSLREMTRRTVFDQSAGAAELTVARADQRQLSEENRRLQTQVDGLQQELASLTYSISHDLRAPLRSVHGFSQALAEDYGSKLDAAAHDYLRRVRSSAQHMDALVDDLLTLSRIVRAPFHVETVDLTALATGIVNELAKSDPTRRVEWHIQPGMSVNGDRPLLGTALRHLLGNAWKFSARRSVARITLRARQPGAGASSKATIYEVADNGVGFDMQYAGKLFGAFQRMCAHDEFPGRGLGLAAVQRIIRRHGGSIQAAAEPDGGAVFSFTLDGLAQGATTAGVPPPREALPVAVDVANVSEPKPSVV